MFTTDKEAINYIENAKKKEKRLNLNRIKKALDYFNHPEKSFKKIHVAGTNGKGSTACFLANLLIKHGYKTGLFISPYIYSFHERIQIDGNYISASDLLYYTNLVYDYNKQLEDKLPFFELTFLIALLYYKNQNVEYAVIEVGLGGLLDPTNSINYDLSLITSIGLDHFDQLGSDITSIALHKLGILKPGNNLVSTVKNDLYPLFLKYTQENNVQFYHIDETQIIKKHNTFIFDNNEYEIKMLGDFQVNNAFLALKAYQILNCRFNLEKAQKALLQTAWPGRLEVIREKPLLFIDGAHNISAINEIITFFEKNYPNKKIYVLFMAMKDKDYVKMIQALEKIAFHFVFTKINYYREEDPHKLSLLTTRSFNVIENIYEALDYTLKIVNEDDIILGIGSLYLVSYFKNN